MSYDIIKSITINHKTKQVFLTSACNNVYPRTPKKWECDSLSEIYATQGLKALEIELLKEFINGNMQKGTSDYNRSIKLFGVPIFEGIEGSYPDYNYDFETAYNNLLAYRALKREKCLIMRTVNNTYIKEVTPRRARLTDNKAAAKVYNLAEAKLILKRFCNDGLELIAA